MALSKIDVANMLTGATPVANGGTALTSGFVNGSDPRPLAKPLIINGNMAVAQRGTSFTHANSNNDNFPVDRFTFQTGSIGEYTSTQESLTSGAAYNAGFRKAARIDCTSADASPSSGDYFWFQYTIEAQDCLVFKKGTSNAEKMTVAFWVKSNKTGTSQLTVKDSDNDRQVAGTYTISTANTWEHKVINLPADTSGAINNDNGAGLRFEWWLGGGSSYTSGSVPTAWEAVADADRGVQNLAINDSTSNDWAITGIQVEVGEFSSTTLPPFQHEDFGDNLARCQRYYLNYAEGSGKMVGMTASYSSSEVVLMHNFPTSMRSAPTLEINTGSSYYSHGENGAVQSITGTNISIDRAHSNGAQFLLTSMSANSGDGGFLYTGHGSSKISYKAEL